jgi:cytoskeletal protein CcmA (bactofilin family)
MAKPTTEFDSTTINLIGAGTTITGDIVSNGDIRINGVLNGNLTAIKGKLFVGETGKITGEVNCKNADISGSIDGKVVVNELLSLRGSSSITGEISINKLSIEPGSKFNGSCRMNETIHNNIEAKSEKRIDAK